MSPNSWVFLESSVLLFSADMSIPYPLNWTLQCPPFTALSVLSSVVCPLCPLCPVYSVSTLPPTFPLFASSHHPASQTYVTDHCNPVSSNTLGVRYTLLESTSIMLVVIHHEGILLWTIPEKYPLHTWAKQICVQGLREKYPDNTHSFCFELTTNLGYYMQKKGSKIDLSVTCKKRICYIHWHVDI